MQSIYCCGPHGNVGWVSSWKFVQTSHLKVVAVQLTLNHRDAYAFDRSDRAAEQLSAVLEYLRARDDYGAVEVMGRAEP